MPERGGRVRRILRDFGAIAFGEGVSKIAGFLAFAYLARVLAPAAYGAVELAVAISVVALLVVDFGLGPIAARHITRDPTTASRLAGAVPAARGLLALAAFGLTIAAALALGDSSDQRLLILLFGGGLFAAPWTLNWLFQGLERMPWVAPAQTLRMGIFLLGCVVFVNGPEQLLRVGGVEIVAACAMALYYVLAARHVARAPLLRVRDARLGPLLSEATPVGAGQLLWALNQMLPTLAVAALLTVQDVAFFGAAHRVAFSLSSFVFLYFFSLYPQLVRATSDSREGFTPLVSQSMRATGWLGIGGALLASLWAEPLSVIAYGAAFRPSGQVLALLIWVFPLSLASGHARFALIAAGEQRREMGAQAFGVLLSLPLFALLVPAFGALGAASGALLSTLVVWIAAHRFAVRHVGQLPLLGAQARPVAAAGVAALVALALAPESVWWRGAIAIAVYTALACGFERRWIGEALRPASAARSDEAAQ